MKDIVLLGGGGHCRSCIDVIESTKSFKICGIVAGFLTTETEGLGYPLIGTDSDLAKIFKKYEHALIAVGHIKNPKTRMHLYSVVTDIKFKLPPIVSPRAYCSSNAVIGQGTILMHFSCVNTLAVIGVNCIINSYALVEHDVVIGDHVHVSTGAKINGGVSIGDGTFIGSGAVIKEGINIGKNVVVGAGQTVLTDIPSKTTVP